MSTSYAEPVLAWYARHARDLPWRAPDATPWAVLVSEIMLQQTPVARVWPEYLRWIARWPTPAALAAEPAGEAIRQWGRLGYPRRALRLHETATILTTQHDGKVPADRDVLITLPGIGSYTAAAVASFAFGHRHAVLDTNVRRVLARLVGGQPGPAAAPSVAEQRLAESLLPADPAMAARWSVAVMELGALVCTAASAAGVGHRAIHLRYSGSTRATGVCCSIISLTSTDQGVAPGARQGRSRAWRAYQASTGSA